ncbi:hypothetical protein [Actinophytocola gossypii]|uniref:Uncharacterized protein n=1 Tax=Actinophytocola gossypii TaxID=2812003 RepID=A0ABT2JCV2_9PSEU|nr:hypothetical protein [Actinophytocola gossypii]MCT2585697.1 hypothetical protein [Actinophytocola gossypii]
MWDLTEADAFYRGSLGTTEAWRDGDLTIAYAQPDTSVRLMVPTSGKAAGPMYLVPSVAEYLAANPGFDDPSGNRHYVFGQRT